MIPEGEAETGGGWSGLQAVREMREREREMRCTGQRNPEKQAVRVNNKMRQEDRT